MTRRIDAEQFRKKFFELDVEFRPSQIDAVLDCLEESELVDAETIRLIDAEALKSYIEEHSGDGLQITHPLTILGYMEGIDDTFEAIDAQPTVEAEPIKHGHYIKGDNGEWFCSECRRIDDKYGVAKYCWNCGAKMDGGE